jgi:hypothetical protein
MREATQRFPHFSFANSGFVANTTSAHLWHDTCDDQDDEKHERTVIPDGPLYALWELNGQSKKLTTNSLLGVTG